MAYPSFTHEDVKHLDEIFRLTVTENLDEYYKTHERIALDRTAMYDTKFYVRTDKDYSTSTLIGEYSNWSTVQGADLDELKADMLRKTRKLAQEVAFTADFLIRQVAQAHNATSFYGAGDWHRVVPSLSVIDLIQYSDNSENLKVNFVISSPSGLEIDEQFLGWVAYKFKFAIIQ